MSEKSRTEEVARNEIRRAHGMFKRVAELREDALKIAKETSANLQETRDSLDVIKCLRWGKELMKDELKDSVYLPDLLRLFEEDARE